MSVTPRGIIVPTVTPLSDEGKFDPARLRRLIGYLVDNGVHGLFPIGTTGESYGFTLEEKRAIFQATVEEAGGRVPVYAGTGAITTRDSVNLTRMAEQCGVDAVSVLTPMFIAPNQQELIRHFETIARATRLPVILYNNPPRTGINITAETVEHLADVENIVGIKDSSGDFSLLTEYIRRTRGRNFHVLAGRDTLIYACLCHGGAGAIAACANVAPRACVDIYARHTAGDLHGSLEAQSNIAPLRMAFSLGTFPAVIKEALALIGIDCGPCLAPIGPVSAKERQQLAAILTAMGLMPAGPART